MFNYAAFFNLIPMYYVRMATYVKYTYLKTTNRLQYKEILNCNKYMIIIEIFIFQLPWHLMTVIITMSFEIHRGIVDVFILLQLPWYIVKGY